MASLANKHFNCLKYTEAGAISSSHTVLHSQWPRFCVEPRDDSDWVWLKTRTHPYLEDYILH